MSAKRTVFLLPLVLMLALTAGMIFAQSSQSLAAPSNAQETSLAAPLGSGFTYQGRLTDGGGNPVNDVCDLDFTLWDAGSGGTVIGHQIVFDVVVDDGYLTVLLNGGDELGERPFQGEARWLKIAVKCSGDAEWHILPGRQILAATPYALSLQPGAIISGTITGRNALSVVNYGVGGNALGGYSHDADGVHGQSVDGAGVSAFSFNQVAFYGESRYNTAGFFTSTHGFGVGANTTSDDPGVAAVEATNQGAGPGVVGYSSELAGVYGNSTNGHGVEGFSVNEVGVYGQSTNTAGYFTSTQGIGVHANTTSDDLGVAAVQGVNLGAGPGVEGFSNDNTGVYGNSTNGHGVEGFSVNEVGVYGQSTNTAGYFTSTQGIGVHANTTSDDPNTAAVVGVNLGAGPGGYFANQGSGTVLYAAGDVAQDATAAGLVKAAAYLTCAGDPFVIYRAFNTVSGYAAATTTGAVGECSLDFDFDLSARFWVAMAYDDTVATMASCTLDPGDNGVLLCRRWDSAGNPANGAIMVLVY
jgi:hypothetical protein